MDATDREIELLRAEARMYGDERMVELCDAALRGNTTARRACCEAIEDARAQDQAEWEDDR